MILFKDKIIKLYILSISILLSSVIIGYDGYDYDFLKDKKENHKKTTSKQGPKTQKSFNTIINYYLTIIFF